MKRLIFIIYVLLSANCIGQNLSGIIPSINNKYSYFKKYTNSISQNEIRTIVKKSLNRSFFEMMNDTILNDTLFFSFKKNINCSLFSLRNSTDFYISYEFYIKSFRTNTYVLLQNFFVTSPEIKIKNIPLEDMNKYFEKDTLLYEKINEEIMIQLNTIERILTNKPDISLAKINVSVDAYTGERKIETDFIRINGATYRLNKKNNNIYLYISINSNTALSINAGEYFYMKFTDGSVIKFYINSTSYPDYSSYAEKYYNSFLFLVTGSDLQQLRKKQVDGIKCYINDYDQNDYDGELLRQNFNAIYEVN